MNVSSGTQRLWRIVPALAIAAALPLLTTGCGGKKAACNQPGSELYDHALKAPTVYEREPVSTAGLRGPRSQEELEALYRIPEPVPLPPIRRAETSSVPAPQQEMPNDERIVGQASWEVPITREWRHIVVHHSASANGSADAFDRAHRARGWDGLGYHFVIGNGSGSGDGEVEVGYRWRKQTQGAHAGNAEYNQHGIGICLVGDFQNGAPPSAAQMASLRQLVRYLQVKAGIPTSEVVGHQNVPGKSTECPGRLLDMNQFRASLGGNGAIPVPIHISNAGGGKKSGKTPATQTRGPSRIGAL